MTVKRSPGLTESDNKTSKAPLEMIMRTPVTADTIPTIWGNDGFSLFISHENKIVMTGMVAMTSEILVAVVN